MVKGEIIVGGDVDRCGCGRSLDAAAGTLFCPDCLRESGRDLADVLSACRWRGRDDWSSAGAARLPRWEAEECRAIHEAVRGRTIPGGVAAAAALWCSFRDAAISAVEIYGRDGIEEYGRRYHWRWAVHRMEWDAEKHLGRLSDEERALGWDAMNAAWGRV